ncbi:amino acid/amide ABC transporter ATP-binding protein 2, HAAT family [Rhizobiales bacterium GAS191]|nr:amino acid/amide ABC transporter ATP-binding protein 2, HAAT family [Rhizobiales bacterium GAS113]SED88783.1 amino acid/amide ABC transporter ATP-binding protein 2, HAAT family [Rhizobiales bacterium GAS191]SEE57359.1 amino acid/amide ABC transporter ATP-binding protein 2, HAAT family [Rhizobiales bacterium GAS188]
MLEIRDLDLFYGDAQALDHVSLEVAAGEMIAIVGANGAGKTSLIRTIFGMQQPTHGAIRFEGSEIAGEPPHLICNLGIGQVAEGRQIFPNMSVAENLEMGAAIPRARAGAKASLDKVLTMFPRLAERRRQLAGTLSGGEQQMLAIGRCLMGQPRLIMFDEPSLGLAPVVVEQVMRVIRDLNTAGGITIVLVEQNVAQSLSLADRGYVLENGRIAMSGTGAELLADDRVRKAYVGL